MGLPCVFPYKVGEITAYGCFLNLEEEVRLQNYFYTLIQTFSSGGAQQRKTSLGSRMATGGSVVLTVPCILISLG